MSEVRAAVRPDPEGLPAGDRSRGAQRRRRARRSGGPGAGRRTRPAGAERSRRARPGGMTTTVRPFLMFEGRAEEAMKFYVSTLPNSEIRKVERYDEKGPGPAGSVKVADFTVAGQALR